MDRLEQQQQHEQAARCVRLLPNETTHLRLAADSASAHLLAAAATAAAVHQVQRTPEPFPFYHTDSTSGTLMQHHVYTQLCNAAELLQLVQYQNAPAERSFIRLSFHNHCQQQAAQELLQPQHPTTTATHMLPDGQPVQLSTCYNPAGPCSWAKRPCYTCTAADLASKAAAWPSRSPQLYLYRSREQCTILIEQPSNVRRPARGNLQQRKSTAMYCVELRVERWLVVADETFVDQQLVQQQQQLQGQPNHQQLAASDWSPYWRHFDKPRSGRGRLGCVCGVVYTGQVLSGALPPLLPITPITAAADPAGHIGRW